MPIASSGPTALVDDVLFPITLAVVMFGVGLGLQVDDFRRILFKRRAFCVGMASMLLIVPAAGISLALLLGPSPALTIGLNLLASCPSGILSNAVADLAKCDDAPSVSMTICLSLIYLFILSMIIF